MIAIALAEMLKTLPELAQLEGRVYPVRFEQAKQFPALVFNTRNVQNTPCRVAGGEKQGVVELSILAKTSMELQAFSESLNDKLDGFDVVVAGYSLSFEVSDDDFEEPVTNLDALNKQLYYEFTATKIN